MVGSVMNEQNEKKYSNKIAQFITKWSAPFVSLLSYGLIFGLVISGLGVMGMSILVGLFIETGSLSGFGFLTGGIIFTAGGTLILWKLTRELDALSKKIKKSEIG